MALPPVSPGSTRLVTGVSSGIGADLARELAARDHGVTLVARRQERLRELADDLTRDIGIRADARGAPGDRGDRDGSVPDRSALIR